MKRVALLALFAGLLFRPVPIAAQEHEPAAEKHEAAGEGKEESFAERHELELKIANFVILAGLIGYFIGKNAGPFFASRSEGIRKDLDESMRQAKEAKERAADVDRRLASLEADIAALRAESDKEMQSETARMSKHTAEEIAKIQAHAEQEIASAGKAARMDLKRYSAELAVNLAEQKIRSRMTPDTQDGLVQGFVQNLK
jgi:F-type H+-transporting ATPase subunit b